MNNNVGSITFIRPKKIMAWAMPVDLFVDGFLIGSVHNGETKTFPIYYGTHTLIAKSGVSETSFQFTVNENQKNLVFDTRLKLGAMSPKIIINFLHYYN